MLVRKKVPFNAAKNHLTHFFVFALLSVWAVPASAAPKTDIVVFRNGDHLTGELLSLKRGRVNLNTDAAGTIGIEWDKVASITSNQHVQIETTSGIRYFGTLRSAEDEPGVIIVTETGPQSLDPLRVISMSPIESKGITRLDVDVSLGYNFAKAGGVETGNFGMNMDYRSLIRIESIKFSTTISDSDTQEESRRSNLGLQHTRLWKNRWFTNGSLSFDQNDELGLNLRTSVGGNIGRFLVQSNQMLWSLEAGLQVSREDQVSDPEDQDSVEATFGLNWDWFLFQDPELDWSTTLQIIPSLTDSGRVRGEVDTALQWEIINDFKWGIAIYGSFDNQSQGDDDVTGATSDYGINTTFTYEF